MTHKTCLIRRNVGLLVCVFYYENIRTGNQVSRVLSPRTLDLSRTHTWRSGGKSDLHAIFADFSIIGISVRRCLNMYKMDI